MILVKNIYLSTFVYFIELFKTLKFIKIKNNLIQENF